MLTGIEDSAFSINTGTMAPLIIAKIWTTNVFEQNPPVSSRTSSIYRPSVSVRNFSISSRFFASPQLKSTDGQAPVDPSAQGDLLKSAPTAISLAKQLRKRATGTTETYVAYGSTESLFKTCAEQADYDIPQVRERRGLAEKSAEGEDLGIGQGWWYSGKSIHASQSIVFECNTNITSSQTSNSLQRSIHGLKSLSSTCTSSPSASDSFQPLRLQTGINIC